MIDIVGLQISTAEFLWTVISFFLFTFLLKKFLYDPILKALDAREAHIKEGLREGKDAQKALDESKARFAAQLGETGNEARAIISDARSAAEKTKSEALSLAHTEAEKLRVDVRARLAEEKSEAESSLENDMPELVAILTGRLLGSNAVTADDELIRDCIEASRT